MTEAEWLACADPDRMLRALTGVPSGSGLLGWLRGSREAPRLKPASRRQMTLFACACCRNIADLMNDDRSRRAVEVVERHADGRAGDAELAAAREAALDAYDTFLERGKTSNLPSPYLPEADQAGPWRFAAQAAAALTQSPAEAVDAVLRAAMAVATEWDDAARAAAMAGAAARVAVLRDIFGNPFRPVRVDPSWLRWNDGTVPRIAQRIYHEDRFEDLPILHDALLDAGCDDEELLAHCRTSDGHVRGCWVVDALLGKS
jgi:hypothetical protein